MRTLVWHWAENDIEPVHHKVALRCNLSVRFHLCWLEVSAGCSGTSIHPALELWRRLTSHKLPALLPSAVSAEVRGSRGVKSSESQGQRSGRTTENSSAVILANTFKNRFLLCNGIKIKRNGNFSLFLFCLIWYMSDSKCDSRIPSTKCW